MSHVVVMGAGIGGMPAAYELKKRLGRSHAVTLVGASEHFQFTPSNPWVAVGWRKPDQVTVAIRPNVEKKGIRFIAEPVAKVEPAANRLVLAGGGTLDYDYLVITTGPKLAFDEVPGLGPEGHTQSVCTTPHAEQASRAYEAFLANPGPVVIGAVQGASCFGPAYEFAMIMDADLRRRKLRDRVPMTLVTSEPYIGHLGLGGVGDSKGMLESELRQRHIKWITNAKLLEAKAGAVRVAEHDDKGAQVREHELPSRFTMFIPAFKGVDAVAAAVGALQSARLRADRRVPAQPTLQERLLSGCLRCDSARRGHARADRRTQDRLHDRVDGERDREQHRRLPSKAGSRRTRRPGTPSASPTWATRASPSSRCRRFRPAT